MDRLEKLAFNSLPAALWPDVTANVYHHRSNEIQTHGQYDFSLYFCCSANVHQGWPKFVLSLVQTLDDGRVVISGFAPSVTTLPSSSGDDVIMISVNGSYPFSDVVTITPSHPTDLMIRIPCFADSATITLGDSSTPLTAPSCAFFNVSTKTSMQVVTVTFQMTIRVDRDSWVANETDGSYQKNPRDESGPNGGAIEIHRGPLTYSLRPNSTVTTTLINASFPTIKTRSVAVTTDPGTNGNWSYGILPATAKFIQSGVGVPAIPFSVTDPSPVMITVQARNLNFGSDGAQVWTDSGNPPHSPLTSDAPLETIELVPFGSTNVRISVFPELKT